MALTNTPSCPSSMTFYLTILLALGAGIAVGLIMVRFGVTEYEVLFTTTNVGVTLAIFYNQHRFRENEMPKKHWQVNLGLVEGYDINISKTHTLEEVYSAFKNWIIARRKAKQPILSGAVQNEMMIYPMGDDGANLEPSVIIKGELSPKFDKGRSDDEVVETLRSLATSLLVQFKQNRVYYSYLDVQYTVDAKDVNHSLTFNLSE